MLTGCQFYPTGEYLKFVRLPENLPRGAEVLTLEVHPRNHLAIMPFDKVRNKSLLRELRTILQNIYVHIVNEIASFI